MPALAMAYLAALAASAWAGIAHPEMAEPALAGLLAAVAASAWAGIAHPEMAEPAVAGLRA